MNENRSLIKAGAIGLAAVGGGAALLFSAPVIAAAGIVAAIAIALVAGRMQISDSANRTNSPSQHGGNIITSVRGDNNNVNVSVTQRQTTVIGGRDEDEPMVTVRTPLGKGGIATMHCGHYPARDWRRPYNAQMRELRELGYTFHGSPEVRSGRHGVTGIHANTFFRKGQRRISE